MQQELLIMMWAKQRTASSRKGWVTFLLDVIIVVELLIVGEAKDVEFVMGASLLNNNSN